MGKTVDNNNISIISAKQKITKFSFWGDKELFFTAILLIFVVFLSWGALGRVKKQIRFDLQETLQKVLGTTNEIVDRWIGLER